MSVNWKDLTFEPDADAVQELTTSWGWLLKQPFTPLLFSALGDMVFLNEAGEVFWLNTGTADISKVASSKVEFFELLKTEIINDWFLPPLIENLRMADKQLARGHCYTYVTLPIFNEGKYVVENFNPVPARQHFSATGYIHRQIRELPDGAKVQLNVVE
jgi:hypothetical protein